MIKSISDAVPKNILEKMDVSSLTREQVENQYLNNKFKIEFQHIILYFNNEKIFNLCRQENTIHLVYMPWV